MSLFACDNCGCVENTATSRYWFRNSASPPGRTLLMGRKLCSECDPDIGRWHGYFDRVNAAEAGYARIGNSDFIERKVDG